MEPAVPIFGTGDEPHLCGKVTNHAATISESRGDYVFVSVLIEKQRPFGVRMTHELAKQYPVGSEVELTIQPKEQ